jgi:hypothetical protein
MFNFYIILLGFIILVASFLELLVFNEEILLTLCFLSFIFFVYTSLGDSISSNFSEQARKYENGLLIAFNEKFSLLKDQIRSLNTLINISTPFILFEYLFTIFIQKRKNFTEKSINISTTSLILNKLNEIYSVEQKAITSAHNNILQNLIYPLLFSSFKTKPVTLFETVKKSKTAYSTLPKERALILKSLITN